MVSHIKSPNKLVISDTSFVEIQISPLTQNRSQNSYLYTYQISYTRNNECVLGYNSENGQTHYHKMNQTISTYQFLSIEKTLEEFFIRVREFESNT